MYYSLVSSLKWAYQNLVFSLRKILVAALLAPYSSMSLCFLNVMNQNSSMSLVIPFFCESVYQIAEGYLCHILEYLCHYRTHIVLYCLLLVSINKSKFYLVLVDLYLIILTAWVFFCWLVINASQFSASISSCSSMRLRQMWGNLNSETDPWKASPNNFPCPLSFFLDYDDHLPFGTLSVQLWFLY